MLTHGLFATNAVHQQVTASPVTIRKAAIHDIEQLPALAKITYLETYPDYFSEKDLEVLFGQAYQQKLPDELINPDIQYLVCEHHGKLIGYAKLHYLTDHVFLDKLYLRSEYQGRGLGKKLLMEVYQLAADKNYNAIQLRAAENKPSIPFYEKHGFIELSRNRYVKPSGEHTNSYSINMACNNVKAVLEQAVERKFIYH